MVLFSSFKSQARKMCVSPLRLSSYTYLQNLSVRSCFLSEKGAYVVWMCRHALLRSSSGALYVLCSRLSSL
jgi:hypothetical protein